MDYFQSPTGTWQIRNDSKGGGTFLSPRGARIHNGIDLTVLVGQDIYGPVKGVYQKLLDPYGDRVYHGMRIVNTWSIIDLLYVTPRIILNDTIAKGQIIGTAENVSEKYGSEMIPHVHFKAIINPVLLNEEALRQWVLDQFKNILT